MLPDFISEFSITLPTAGQSIYEEAAKFVLSSQVEDSPKRQREEALSRRVAEIQLLLLEDELPPDHDEGELLREQAFLLKRLEELRGS